MPRQQEYENKKILCVDILDDVQKSLCNNIDIYGNNNNTHTSKTLEVKHTQHFSFLP